MIITWLLNAQPDPQRGGRLPANVNVVGALAQSLRGHRLTVLSDCLEPGTYGNIDVVRVEAGHNPYFHRWRVTADHLEMVPADRLVWCVDGTDVIMLNDPFPAMTPGEVYVGSECTTVGCQWMMDFHPSRRDWLRANSDRVLLNAGLLGGCAADVRRYASLVAEDCATDLTDMAAFNEIGYTAYPAHVTGRRVHTPYKSYARSGDSWWAHK